MTDDSLTAFDVFAKSPETLRQNEIVRQTLEAAARRIEQQAGNDLYERAWRRAAEIVRSMKPE